MRRVALVSAGAVAAFLIFNIPAHFNRRFRCFMGDAGSTLLGFLLACMCISISQGEGPKISPTTALWVVAIPLYELLWTTLRRVLRGTSPFHPDRAHFHHKLLDAGFGVRGAFFVLICMGLLSRVPASVIHSLEIPDGIVLRPLAADGPGHGDSHASRRACSGTCCPQRFRRLQSACARAA